MRVFETTAKSVSDFKKENKRSPVQQEARDNKQLVKNVDAAAGVGWIAIRLKRHSSVQMKAYPLVFSLQ